MTMATTSRRVPRLPGIHVLPDDAHDVSYVFPDALWRTMDPLIMARDAMGCPLVVVWPDTSLPRDDRVFRRVAATTTTTTTRPATTSAAATTSVTQAMDASRTSHDDDDTRRGSNDRILGLDTVQSRVPDTRRTATLLKFRNTRGHVVRLKWATRQGARLDDIDPLYDDVHAFRALHDPSRQSRHPRSHHHRPYPPSSAFLSSASASQEASSSCCEYMVRTRHLDAHPIGDGLWMESWHGDWHTFRRWPAALEALQHRDARWIVLVSLPIAYSLMRLWRSGLAYTDLKVKNLLWRIRSDDSRQMDVALADLGGLAILPCDDDRTIITDDGGGGGGRRTGLATYPAPERRPADEDTYAQGVFKNPGEADVVWGLGIVWMQLLDYVQGEPDPGMAYLFSDSPHPNTVPLATPSNHAERVERMARRVPRVASLVRGMLAWSPRDRWRIDSVVVALYEAATALPAAATLDDE